MTREEAGVSPIMSSLPPAGQIDAEEDHDPPGDLIDPQRLAEEHDTRRDPNYGDHVLVDEHPVRPDAAYPPLPSRERESGGEDSGVGDCGPRSCPHAAIYKANLLGGGHAHE